MDLGFGHQSANSGSSGSDGHKNAFVGRTSSNVAATTSILTKVAACQEAALDHELNQYDALLKDDDALDVLREQRLKALKQHARQVQLWKDTCGHGAYSELTGIDIAKAFFDATKKSERLVVHFYRPSTRYCDVFHKYFRSIAETHLETKFLKINVEASQEGNQGLQYIIEKLHIRIMPTVVLIHKRKQVHQFRGLDDLGGTEDFSIDVLKHVLAAYDVLTLTSSEMDQLEDQDWEKDEDAYYRGVNTLKLNTIRRGIYEKEED